MKRRTGFPKGLILTYAKNVKSRVIDIVQLLVEAGLQATGIISLQTSYPENSRGNPSHQYKKLGKQKAGIIRREKPAALRRTDDGIARQYGGSVQEGSGGSF